jgi:putative protein-disulfide isomerase
LICDVETGACEIPLPADVVSTNSTPSSTSRIKVTYFTDPICSSCWGIEPQLRKLKLEYGDAIAINYRMGGLLPSWEGFNGGGITKPSDVAHHWDVVSHHYQMPIDGDVWIEDPLSSSYPPSIAFLAAGLQGDEKAQHYMRRIREMVFLEKKNISKWEFLKQAAVETDLDTARFEDDYHNKARQLFAEDLQFTKESGVRGFPTLIFTNGDGKDEILFGSKPYTAFEQIVLQLDPQAQKNAINETVEGILDHYPSFTTKEFSVMTGRPLSEVEDHLNGLYNSGTLDRYVTKNGVLWKKK